MGSDEKEKWGKRRDERSMKMGEKSKTLQKKMEFW
jgi:hypothetical protein